MEPHLRQLLFALLLACGIAPVARAETFDNASVIALSRAGLDEAIIVAKVSALPCGYDLTTAGLLALRRAGVGQKVLVAMLHRCTGSPAGQETPLAAERHAPGIYLAGAADGSSAGPLVVLRPAATVGVKTTGIGSLFFPRKATLTITRPHAEIVAHRARPTFWFYFDPADRKTNTFGTPVSWAAQSPGEFSLVRFKPNGNTRQLAIGRVGPYSDVMGLDPAVALPFTIDDLGEGCFRVGFAGDLPPGEYGFLLIGEGPRNRTSYRVFDFTVTPPASLGASVNPASR